MRTSSSSASLPPTLFSLPPRRDDNRINVSLGFRQRADQIRVRGVETPDWLLYLTECLGVGGATLVVVVVFVVMMGGIKSKRKQRHEAQTHLFFLPVFTSILEGGVWWLDSRLFVSCLNWRARTHIRTFHVHTLTSPLSLVLEERKQKAGQGGTA